MYKFETGCHKLARIKIKMFCGIQSLKSFMKTSTAAGGTVVVFTIGGRLSTKHALLWKVCGLQRYVASYMA